MDRPCHARACICGIAMKVCTNASTILDSMQYLLFVLHFLLSLFLSLHMNVCLCASVVLSTLQYHCTLYMLNIVEYAIKDARGVNKIFILLGKLVDLKTLAKTTELVCGGLLALKMM